MRPRDPESVLAEFARSTDARPTPRPLIVDPEQSPAARRLDCRKYNPCLSLAARLGWASFECNGCPAHEPMSKIEHRADMEAMAGVLREVRRGARRRATTALHVLN